jgi:translation initiation factor IF-2
VAEDQKKKIVIKKKKPTIKIRLKNKEEGAPEKKETAEKREARPQKPFRERPQGPGAGPRDEKRRPERGGPRRDGKPPVSEDKPLIEKKPEGKKVKKTDWKKKKFQKDQFKGRAHEKEFALQRKKRSQAAIPEEIEITDTILVKDLARKMNLKVGGLIKKLMELGYMATINDALDSDTAEIVASDFGCKVNVKSVYDELQELVERENEEGEMTTRPPVVTVMGHVDHGKTQLLDTIRKANVVAKESGGITQHIGAYQVQIEKGKITFIDTPGHAAFTQMRERGAASTDVVILVVAADDGVMPQTVEALNHAKAAGVPIIVAVNKMDKESANPERVKQQLAELELVPEEWGGDIMFIPVSALKGEGIQKLLESVLLIAEMQELKADPKQPGKAVILETKIDKSKGPTATVVVRDGTLRKGDNFVAGTENGRIRAMFDYTGAEIEEAPPSMAAEIIGFDNLPEAGDLLQVVTPGLGKEISEKRKEIKRIESAKKVSKKVSLDDLYAQMKEGEKVDFNLIVKADVQGTAEAIKGMVERLSSQIEEVNLRVIHSSVGAITENDVLLASASNAIIIGFNTRPNNEKVTQLSKEKEVEIRKYSIIYEIVDDIKAAVEGMLEPEEKEVVIGQVEVRDTFKVPKIGVIAGSYVTDGMIKRNARVRLIRDGIVIHDGKIGSLKRFQEDAKEVAKGYECGVGLESFNDIKVGDVFEVYEIREFAKKLTLKTEPDQK